jgi:hypothetical protein
MSANRRDRGVLSNRFRTKSRRRSKGAYALENLESRVVLSYTFSLVGQTATVLPVAATGGPILIDEIMISGNPFLEWSQDNGATFSVDWDSTTPGDQTLPANTASTINLTPTSGAGSSITLGTAASAASNIFALFHLGPPGTPANNSVTIDDSTSTHAAGTYDFYSTLGAISGPGGTAGGINFTSFGPVNSYLLEGGPAANTFDIHSTFNATTTSNTIVGGAGDDTANVLGDTSPGIGTPLTINLGAGTNVVNVGNGNVASTIFAPVQVTGSSTELNIENASNTTSSTATLDDLSGNPATPFEVTGLGAPIEYGPGVTALNINGGAFGAAGVTYNVNNTQAGTNTTINGGPNQNFINLSNASEPNGLDNLAGPVVVHGGTSFLDVVTLDDSDRGSTNDNYVVTSTTVSRPFFAGLTYDDNIGTLTLLAENTLGADGNNIIDVNSTADFVNTNIFGQGGVDTINVDDTGSSGTLDVTTGADAGSTVNVVADNEPVNIVGGADSTVNIGSTGGDGSMAGIQGPISVTNPPALTALVFHDENDTTGQTWTLDNDDTVPSGSVAVTGSATTSYNPVDLSSLTINGGSGGNTFTVDNTSGFYPTTLNTGTGTDATTVFDTGDFTLNIHGQDGTDTVMLGSDPALGMQGLAGTINVDNALDFTALTLDDSEDTLGQTALLFNDGTNGQVTGLSPATINYVDGDVSSLTVNGGSGGNTFTVDGTINNPFVVPALTTLNTGLGDDSTTVEATNAGGPLTINGQAGQDTVSISFFGSVADILGDVLISNPFGFTDVTVDASADAVSHDFTLSSSGVDSSVVDLAPATITYVTLDVSSLTLSTSDFGSQVMNIDMSGGNPIPFSDTPGLTFNAGADSTSGLGTHVLNIFGTLPTGPFHSETHNANDPTVFPQAGQFGSISFDDGKGLFNSLTSLWYTGLQPINDTTPATLYTFNDFANDPSFTATSGSVTDPSGTFDTIQFANTPPVPPPTFETTNVANKTNIVFNTEPFVPGMPSLGIISVVNIPTASTGLATLTFNTPTPLDNTTSFLNEPPGVVTSFNGSAEPDITNVTGVGVPLGTVLSLNGGASTNTLNYDAGGEIPTITPGLLPGELLISIPGFGTVDAINYQVINITGMSPVVITPGPAVTINTVEGFNYVNALVGTFTTSIPFFPGGPTGLPASDFLASIDWGDLLPSDPGAGTITQDASNPSIYYVTGTHTYLENGTFTVGTTLGFTGGSFTATIGGVPITFTFGPSGPTPGAPATAAVTQGSLAVSAFPIVGTEGIPIGPIPIATFIDAGGAGPIGDYSATVAITAPDGTFQTIAATVTQNGNANQYTVTVDKFTLPEEGTYQVTVLVTDSGGTTPISASGASLAVIADAPLAPGPDALLTGHTGIPTGSIVIGSFTDGNTGSDRTDFTGTIDWGDGSPTSVASFLETAPGAFNVLGNHTYAKPGSYTVIANIQDVGGSKVTLTASFTITDLAVTGQTQSFTAVEGQSTGLFVLATFTDPNTLATVADVNATLAVGGWGDHSPPPAPNSPLVIQQIGVTPLTSATDPGDPIFEVLGIHTYAEETPAGLPDTLSVIITTLGGVSTTLTSPPGGGVTVLDAQLTSSNGTEITGVEGITTGTVLLGTFTDGNQGSTVADFTTAPGSTVVKWGDGSTTSLTAANLAAVGSPDGVIYTVSASHIYTEEGTYAYTVTVTDDGGSVTIFSGSAIVADAPLSPSATQPTVDTAEPTIFPVPVFSPPLFSGPVASFTDANPAPPVGSSTIADFTASIDWGDGTPMTAGTVSQPGGPNTAYIVSGMHTYAASGVTTGTGTFGTYPIQVFVQDDGGSRLTVDNTAHVEDTSIPLSGQLNPASDSGLSTGTANTTNVVQPDFFGTSQALSTVTLSATLQTPGSTPFVIGQVEAGSNGSWNIQSDVKLADGHYTITATAIDQFGETTVTTPPSPVVINSNLLIDTQGPVVTGMFFNRLNGQVDFTIQDPGATPSGIWVNTLLDSSNYLFTKVHPQKDFPGEWIVTNVTATPDPTLPNAYDVAVTIGAGHVIRGGFYLFTIRDSSNGNSSVQDLAENHLDGVFYGSFPSGNGINGSDFVAELQAYHYKVFAPQTIIGTANAANGGVGGPRVNPVHSGVFMPVIPRGGAPIFSSSTGAITPLARKAKGQVNVKAKHGASLIKHDASHVKHPKVVLSKNHPKGPSHS